MKKQPIQGPCDWCGDSGFAKIGNSVLCPSCYEYAALHWRS